MTETPARDFLLPRLRQLMAEAVQRGLDRDAATAVMIDIVTGPGFNDTPLDPLEDTAPATPDVALRPGEEDAERRGEAPILGDRDPVVTSRVGLRRAAQRGTLAGRPPR